MHLARQAAIIREVVMPQLRSKYAKTAPLPMEHLVSMKASRVARIL